MTDSKRIKRRMTAAEFEAVIPLMKISDKRRDAARLALVDGLTFQAVADRMECSRQAVDDAIGSVWRAYTKLNEAQRVASNAGTLLPPGWEQITLVAPSELVARFRAEIAEWSQRQSAPTSAVEKPASAPRRATKQASSH
ncbi:TrfB-related DNA-binding protein [Achromobacter spanius]|uniref:TrfB-related DNA-binding protein n=1 Tax=Achromobacter spanius TaxID=217203 RepID=UPI0038269FC1